MTQDTENIARWLQEAVEKYGEPLESVVVGIHDDLEFGTDPALPDENIVLAPDVALAKLNVEYSAGYGGAECFPVYAWTKSRVFFIHEYDGSTSLNWVPRHPVPCEPEFGGESL
jgi:hypothetical protein